jgi:hypothetical protein
MACWTEHRLTAAVWNHGPPADRIAAKYTTCTIALHADRRDSSIRLRLIPSPARREHPSNSVGMLGSGTAATEPRLLAGGLYEP